MKQSVVTIYTCAHCGKYYKRKHFCLAHEKMCKKNPENDRQCFYCQFLSKKDVEMECDEGYGEYLRTVTLFFCEKREEYVYTPQNEMKGNAFAFDEPNEPMPKQCDDRDNYHDSDGKPLPYQKQIT